LMGCRATSRQRSPVGARTIKSCAPLESGTTPGKNLSYPVSPMRNHNDTSACPKHTRSPERGVSGGRTIQNSCVASIQRDTSQSSSAATAGDSAASAQSNAIPRVSDSATRSARHSLCCASIVFVRVLSLQSSSFSRCL
jgi:hypothetical protein